MNHAPEPGAPERGAPEHGVREHGDRHSFLSRASTFAARHAEPNLAHPLPLSSIGASEFAPITYDTLSALATGESLADVFARNASTVLLNVFRFTDNVPADSLRALIESEGIETAVVSAMPEAVAVGEQLRELGVAVSRYTPEVAVTADLGVTAPLHAIAATGSLVQDSTLEGGRGMSLVPRLHLAVLPASRIVRDTATVFGTFSKSHMPANVVLISGPSRTGDIEMILTVGVHGPIKVFIALLDDR